VTVGVFCQSKSRQKLRQNAHPNLSFRGKNDFFLAQPLNHTQPPRHLRRLTPSLLKSCFMPSQALDGGYYNIFTRPMSRCPMPTPAEASYDRAVFGSPVLYTSTCNVITKTGFDNSWMLFCNEIMTHYLLTYLLNYLLNYLLIKLHELSSPYASIGLFLLSQYA